MLQYFKLKYLMPTESSLPTVPLSIWKTQQSNIIKIFEIKE